MAGNWLISLDTLTQALPTTSSTGLPRRRQAGRRRDAGGRATPPSRRRWSRSRRPRSQTNAEFRKSQEAQINQLLVIITVLLGFSIVIAVLGISITLALGVFERTREIGLMRAVGHEQAPDPAHGALGGDHRVDVRRRRRHRGRHACIGIALSLAVPDTVIDRIAFSPVIDRRHPRRSRRRRVHRRPVSVLQGVEHERPAGDRVRVGEICPRLEWSSATVGCSGTPLPERSASRRGPGSP